MFKVGEATVTRVEETNLPSYPLRDVFKEFTDAHMAEHSRGWRRITTRRRPARSGSPCIAGCLQIGGKKILIDCCCGNNKVKPGRPFWHMLNEPYLERLAAAGARPEEIDLVMCTHLHHDHVGWNTQQKDGKWVPTFPNARYVFSKPDVDYFSKVDADPKEGPAELGTFRECVVPILEYGKADLVDGGPHRLNDFIEIMRRPAIRPATWCSSSKARPARRLHRRRLASLAAGLLSGLEFPEELGCCAGAGVAAQGARRLCFKWRAGVSRPCRGAVRRPRRGGAKTASCRISIPSWSAD